MVQTVSQTGLTRCDEECRHSLPSTLWKGKNKSSLSNCNLLLSLPHYLFWKVVAKPTALKQSIYLNETVCVLWSSKSSATLREWRLKISGGFSHKLSAMYFFLKRFHSNTNVPPIWDLTMLRHFSSHFTDKAVVSGWVMPARYESNCPSLCTPVAMFLNA